jgi:hypothetical protein
MLALFEVIVLEPVKLTATGKVSELAPVTVMLFPIFMDAALVNVRLVKAVPPPTAAPKETVPVPALKVRAVAPFSVLVAPEKLMFAPALIPAFVESMVGVLVIATGPVIVMIPLLVKMFAFTLIALAPL